jgi:C-terminal processing protease CtpA/Prc
VNQNNLKTNVGDTYAYLVAGLSDHETEHTRGRVHRFSVAGFAFDDLPVGLSQELAGIQSDEEMVGIIGNEILHRFNVVLNYKKNKMWWSENDKFDGQFFVNCSGILLQLDKTLTKILIHQVYENSPAQAAGLIKDDEIVQVNGKPASEFNLVEIRDLLAEEGKTVTLKVNSAGETRDVQLKLKELI